MNDFCKLMPGIQAMEDVEEPPLTVPDKKRKPEEVSKKGPQKGKGKGKGKQSRNQSARDSDGTSDLQGLVKHLGHMVLRQAEALNRLEYDTCFLIVLDTKPHPGTVIPSLFRVAASWRRKKDEDPAALQQSLRQVMLTCLIKEVQGRADLTLNTPGAKKEAERLGFLEGEACVYQTWDADKQLNVKDPSRKPLPLADFHAQAERMLKYVTGTGLTRFQALKTITPDLENQQIPFLLDISLRDPYTHDVLLAWTQLSVFGLVGGRIRRSRIKPSHQQEQLYQLLRNL